MASRKNDSIYDRHLDPVEANYTPLSPITYLERTASVYPDKTAVIHGDARYTYAQLYERCRRLASALSRHRGGGVFGPAGRTSVRSGAPRAAAAGSELRPNWYCARRRMHVSG